MDTVTEDSPADAVYEEAKKEVNFEPLQADAAEPLPSEVVEEPLEEPTEEPPKRKRGRPKKDPALKPAPKPAKAKPAKPIPEIPPAPVIVPADVPWPQQILDLLMVEQKRRKAERFDNLPFP